MKYFNIETPILILISLLSVKGVKMGVGDIYNFDNSEVIDRDSIIIPDVLLEDYADQPKRILRPIFDAIWQACGLSGSRNYNEKGDWESWRR